MQTLTFTQKLLRQRSLFSSLIPLFALFVGLGAMQTASAQQAGTSIAQIRNVTVTAGQSATTTTTDSYDAIQASGGTGVGGGIFANTNFGSYDASNGRLLLQGGTVEVKEAAGETFQRAFIQYVVNAGTINGVNGETITTVNAPFSGVQEIELVQTGFNTTTRVRTFALSNANRDILALVTGTNDGTGKSHRFDVTVNASGVNSGNDDIVITGSGARRRSVFTATGNPIVAPTITANNVFINPDSGPAIPPRTTAEPGSNVTYSITPATPPVFPGANLSDPANRGKGYDVNSGRLLINGGTATTTENGPNVVSNVILYYRTRLSTAGGGAFQTITLTRTSGVDGGTKTFSLSTADNNLIATAAVTAAGTYALDVYFQANGINSNTGVPFLITVPTPPGVYTANFTVTGEPIAETIWTGSLNDNWFDSRNWSNGVPTATTNALVRDLGAGEAVPYPNIYAGVQVRTAAGVLLFDNTQFPFAEARTLTMGGSSQATRSITRLISGRLKVFGDFNNNFASFIQRENTVIEFAGGDQNITGGTFVAVEISGSGTKFNAGLMEIAQAITFTNGILTTNIKLPLVSLIILADRSAVNNFNGAQINGENDVTYLRGFIKTTRQGVAVGETRTYGNMGMTLTFTGSNSPGNTEVTRNTVESYTPLNNRFGVRRIFGIRPLDGATNTGGLVADMVFRYRDSETMNLGGPSTTTPGTGSIPEPNLTIFFSENSGNTFGLIGRDGPVDVVNNTVTKTDVRRFATITLGDTENPLPVRLTAFDAKRFGSNALITWQTASEENSKGYEVQVSTNGIEFRTLAFVPSANPNSTRLTSYSFEDKEDNKSGVRYYRLHQIDLDGKTAYFAPKAVNFEGKALATAITAYPNPFNGNDELYVALQSVASGKVKLRITDMTGRTLSQQTVEVNAGLTDLSVTGMQELKAGIYLVRVTTPTGETQNLKVVKE